MSDLRREKEELRKRRTEIDGQILELLVKRAKLSREWATSHEGEAATLPSSERETLDALAQGIEDELRKKGKRALSIEGIPAARWVLMDLGDVVVHVFQEEARSLYDIDGLWMDAARLPLPASADPGRGD
jgi:chorismate mutase